MTQTSTFPTNVIYQIRKSQSTYGLTIVYIGASCIIIILSAQIIELPVALVLLTGTVMLGLMVSMYREVRFVHAEARVVHTLVNRQHEELLAKNAELVDRILNLVTALNNAGIDLPERETRTSDQDRATQDGSDRVA